MAAGAFTLWPAQCRNLVLDISQIFLLLLSSARITGMFHYPQLAKTLYFKKKIGEFQTSAHIVSWTNCVS